LRARKIPLTFHLYAAGIDKLDGIFRNNAKFHTNGLLFDRIDASNLMDKEQLGVETTLRAFGRRLKPKTDYPHAAMLTLHTTALLGGENSHFGDSSEPAVERDRVRDVTFSFTQDAGRAVRGLGKAVADMEMFRSFFVDHDKLLIDHEIEENIHEIAGKAGLCMKGENTIVKQWPFRPTMNGGRVVSPREVELALGMGLSGAERYVEWIRK
jgi:hypothetical protein